MSDLRDQGLAALMADVLTADRPDPELLVRYAHDPGSLSSEEREDIEFHLQHTPGCAAQLAILQRMLAARPAGATGPAPAATSAPRRAAPRRAPRRGVGGFLAVSAVAAAAALAIGVGLHQIESSGRDQPSSPQVARYFPRWHRPEA